MKRTRIAAAMAAIGLAVPGVALATDGYFSHGYGMKAKGMAGVATARAVDTFGGANNPASMAFVGNRLDAGVDFFMPIREAERTGSVAPGPGFANLDGKVESDSEFFIIPEFGYNKMLSDRMSLGVTVYGNGGMNTDYKTGQIPPNSLCGAFNPPGNGPYNMLCGSTALGVDLMQLVIAPTLAWKVNESHSIGVAPLIGYQRFAVDGLQGFAGLSSDPTKLTNNGHDDAWGFGVRVGWFGKLTDRFTLGAAWSSKIYMDEFDDYRGLFAEQGDFDMPMNWNIGAAFKATDTVTIGVDFKRIHYSDVDSVGLPSTQALLGRPLGADDGPGFGWDDVNVIKIGVEWQVNPQWALRAGYGHTDNPIEARDVTFNILAPGVVQDHVTLGATYTLSPTSEITFAYMHAFENDVQGSSLFNPLTGAPVPLGGNERIQMYQDSIGIAFGMKL